MKVTDLWKGRSNEHFGVPYKAFKDWQDYAIHLSDEYCFSREFDKALKATGEEEQIADIAKIKPPWWVECVKETIDYYNLTEFNQI